ncbi:nuclear transport factor 2 family protein [Pseudonocardia kujensis]|uniref:nuclear transport factor 2 family protein n=1 Tax=Pseudonocardia kujensis TaxID=1128675 RepID=UPI001E396E9E|nr:nuclear transport factor 2 family protein [Pseudonocardia kujensis]MCE0765550.1 nuclear transport factor 2 family protein [Pseudonocardia kujensis]
MSTESTLPEWLATAIDALSDGDLDGWLAMFAPDGVHELPWAPEDRVRRLEGHAEMRAHMSRLAERLEIGTFRDVQTIRAGDDTVVRATGHHRRLDGTPVVLRYIWFITRRNGKVTHLQDYINPRAAPRRGGGEGSAR